MDQLGNHRRYDCCIPSYLLCDAEAQGKAEQINTPVSWMIAAVVREKCSRWKCDSFMVGSVLP